MQQGERGAGNIQMIDAVGRGDKQVVSPDQQVRDPGIDGLVLDFGPDRPARDRIIVIQSPAHGARPQAARIIQPDAAGNGNGVVFAVERRRIDQPVPLHIQTPEAILEGAEPNVAVPVGGQGEDGVREAVFPPVMLLQGEVRTQKIEPVAQRTHPEPAVPDRHQGGDGPGADHVGHERAAADVVECDILRRDHDHAALVHGQPDVAVAVHQDIVDAHGGRVAGNRVGLEQRPLPRGGVQDTDAVLVRAEEDAAVAGIQDTYDAHILQIRRIVRLEAVRLRIVMADIAGVVRGIDDAMVRIGDRDERVLEMIHDVVAPEAARIQLVDAVSVAGAPDRPVLVHPEDAHAAGGDRNPELGQDRTAVRAGDDLQHVVSGRPDRVVVVAEHVVDDARIGDAGLGLQRRGEGIRVCVIVLDAALPAHQQAALAVLHKGTEGVVRNGMRVGRIMLVGMDGQAVVAVESVVGGYPDVSPPVLVQGVDGAAAQAVPDGQQDAALGPQHERAQKEEKDG